MHRASCAVVVMCLCATVLCEEQSNSTDIIDKLFSDASGAVGRTFGHHVLKRLAFIFLPVVFTLGVITTLLLALTVISIKNLAIGVMLLVVGVSQAVSRLFYAVPPPAAPLIHYAHLRSHVEPTFAAAWPSAAAAQPLLTPWARSDDVGTPIDQ